jgi:hypothetical protein
MYVLAEPVARAQYSTVMSSHSSTCFCLHYIQDLILLFAVVLQLIITHGGSYDAALLDSIAAALTKAGLQERCGDLYQHLGRSLEALQAYRKAHAYRQVCDKTPACYNRAAQPCMTAVVMQQSLRLFMA